MAPFHPYEIHELNESHFQFTTSGHFVYDVLFSFSDRFFDQNCSSCKDILEVDIQCSEDNCPKDYRVGVTINEIFSLVLSDSCNGIMYRCDDKDGRSCERELQFDRWHETFDTEDQIDKFAQEFCDHDDICVKYYLLVDRGCLNRPQVVDDFHYRCVPCQKESKE